MGFLAIVNAYTMRICLNVAITEMTIKKIKNETDNGVCPADGSTGGNSLGKGIFEWDEQLQGIILGSFFWGYVSTLQQ